MEKELCSDDVQFLLRQAKSDRHRGVVECALVSKLEHIKSSLDEEGLTEGDSFSKNVRLQEGQRIRLNFKNNIRAVANGTEVVPEFVFHPDIRSRVQIQLEVVDK